MINIGNIKQELDGIDEKKSNLEKEIIKGLKEMNSLLKEVNFYERFFLIECGYEYITAEGIYGPYGNKMNYKSYCHEAKPISLADFLKEASVTYMSDYNYDPLDIEGSHMTISCTLNKKNIGQLCMDIHCERYYDNEIHIYSENFIMKLNYNNVKTMKMEIENIIEKNTKDCKKFMAKIEKAAINEKILQENIDKENKLKQLKQLQKELGL